MRVRALRRSLQLAACLLAAGVGAASAQDIRVTLLGTGTPAPLIVAEDVTEGFIHKKDGLKITPFDVDHAPVEPAFGYRIDYRGRSVVLSGDTRFSENLIRRAEGVDLLIHEVAAPASHLRAGIAPALVATITAHHTSPEQAGEVFARVKPKLAVYSHIGRPSATEQGVIVPTRKSYAAPLELGEDLMVIEVGETVTVRRPTAAAR
jgi:ribonuclease Z